MNAPVDLEAVCRRAVDAALAAGADDAEAYAEERTEREIRVYDGAVESLTDASSRGIGVRAFADGRSGYAYGTDLGDAGLEELAAAARAAAGVADADPHDGLPDETGAADVDSLRSRELGDWSTERKVELALAAERAARAHPGVSQVEQVVYADSDGAQALANSRGFAGSFEASAAWAYASAFAGEGADLMTGMGLGIGRGPEDLDAEAIGRRRPSARRRSRRAGRDRAGSARWCSTRSWRPASWASSAACCPPTRCSAGRSLFAGREGDEIATPVLRLADDGTLPDGLASSPFDGEGSPRRRLPLIEDGRLQTFLFDTRTARKDGRETTASAERSSYRTPAVGGRQQPGARARRRVARRARPSRRRRALRDRRGRAPLGREPGLRDLLRGASGRLIEGGELGAPVRELTIASDLVSMLRSVSAVGSEARWVPFGGSVRGAPLLLAEMAVSGS